MPRGGSAARPARSKATPQRPPPEEEQGDGPGDPVESDPPSGGGGEEGSGSSESDAPTSPEPEEGTLPAPEAVPEAWLDAVLDKLVSRQAQRVREEAPPRRKAAVPPPYSPFEPAGRVRQAPARWRGSERLGVHHLVPLLPVVFSSHGA
eukprot:scaffold67397_cov33-Tisochrysis_lutea.AAC.1